MQLYLNELPLVISDIKEAHKILKNVVRKTPLVKSFYMSAKTNAEVYLKLENMQLTGSFKFRGAYNKIFHLTKEEQSKGVIACSAGNHAQGVALSSKLLNIKSTIVMPTTAPKAKVAATESYGSKVILHGASFDDAKDQTFIIQNETDETFLHPYDDKYVMAGQGTIGLEILEDLWDTDIIIVPVGGGGIIAGIAVALKSYNPSIRIIGVQAENVHGMKASFDAKKIISHYVAPTLADGCAVKLPGTLTYEIVHNLVDEMVCVSEEELKMSMKDLLQRGKVVVEGAGALATAALLSGKIKDIESKKVVAIISGGNIDLERISSICEHFFGTEAH